MKLNKHAFGLGMIALLVMTSTSAFAASSIDGSIQESVLEAIGIQSAIQTEVQVSAAESGMLASVTILATPAESVADAIMIEDSLAVVTEMASEEIIASETCFPATVLEPSEESIQPNATEESSATVEASVLTDNATSAK